MNACHPYTETSLISYSIHSFGYCERTHIRYIVHGILSAAILLIVVVSGSVICALAVKVHRLRKYSKSGKYDPAWTMLKYSMAVYFSTYSTYNIIHFIGRTDREQIRDQNQ